MEGHIKLGTYVDEELGRQIIEEARKKKLSVSSFIRLILLEYIENKKRRQEYGIR